MPLQGFLQLSEEFENTGLSIYGGFRMIPLWPSPPHVSSGMAGFFVQMGTFAILFD